MAQDPKIRQKKLERKAYKDKQRKKEFRRQQQVAKASGGHVRTAVREAASWPLHEVLVAEHWRDTTQLSQILVARRSPNGEIVAGTFLVDLACMGVKSAFPSRFESVGAYEREFRDGIIDRMPMVSADLNLAAKILHEAVAYAESLGLKPDPDYFVAKLILGDADPSACGEAIPVGHEGKPLYVAGPDDDSRRIIDTLARKLGPEGFHYVLPVDPDLIMLGEDDEGEEE